MPMTQQAQATMLLTLALGERASSQARPLSNNEWARFSAWLDDHGLDPGSLRDGKLPSILGGWIDRSVSIARVEALLQRGAALALALEKWNRAGLWILTRADADYPKRLKSRLGWTAPPVLVGCGSLDLLRQGGIAVVGSRDASPEDLAYAEKLGGEAAGQAHPIVSGGARGIDQSAMLGALERGGTAVGVLADDLLRTSTAMRYREPIMADRLALVTPFNPEAGFNVGNAMSRNRYIYCLADAAVVVNCTPDKGGTWAGAIEDLTEAWVPLWVKPSSDARSGNRELVRRGAHPLPEDLGSLDVLLSGSVGDRSGHTATQLPLAAVRETQATFVPSVGASELSGATRSAPIESGLTNGAAGADRPVPARDFYSIFVERLAEMTAAEPLTLDAVAARLELVKPQAKAWLSQAEKEGKIRKLSKPVRYQSLRSLFDL